MSASLSGSTLGPVPGESSLLAGCLPGSFEPSFQLSSAEWGEGLGPDTGQSFPCPLSVASLLPLQAGPLLQVRSPWVLLKRLPLFASSGQEAVTNYTVGSTRMLPALWFPLIRLHFSKLTFL